MDALKAYALNLIRQRVENGWTVETLAHSREGTVSPGKDGISRWTTLNGGYMFASRDGSGESVRVKPGHVGIAFYYADGHGEIAVFKVADLVDEILDPKPVQLALFEVL